MLFSIVAAFTYANFLLAAPPYRLGPAQLGDVFVVYLLAIVSTPLATRLAVRMGLRPTLALAAATGIAGMLLTLVPALAGIIAGLALAIGGMFIEQVLAIGFIGAARDPRQIHRRRAVCHALLHRRQPRRHPAGRDLAPGRLARLRRPGDRRAARHAGHRPGVLAPACA